METNCPKYAQDPHDLVNFSLCSKLIQQLSKESLVLHRERLPLYSSIKFRVWSRLLYDTWDYGE